MTRAADGAPPAAEVLFPSTRLSARVAELGAEIAADYAGAPRPPVVVGVLKGSTPFLADLCRCMPIDVEVDFMSISSYTESGEQSGVVRIIKDLGIDTTGRDVLLVEDIVDTGLTLNYLRKSLSERRPRSLRAVALLDKLARRIVPVPLEYVGFQIPDVFVVGYGLDFQGRYRNVADLLAVHDLPRLANDPDLLVPSLFGGREHHGRWNDRH